MLDWPTLAFYVAGALAVMLLLYKVLQRLGDSPRDGPGSGPRGPQSST